MATTPLQAESACANPVPGSIDRQAGQDFETLADRIDGVCGLVNLMACADSVDPQHRNAFAAVADLLENIGKSVLESAEKYGGQSQENRPGADPISIAWQAARDFETLAGRIEDVGALVQLLTEADSLDASPFAALRGVSDLLAGINSAVSETEAKYDAICTAARAAGGTVVEFQRSGHAEMTAASGLTESPAPSPRAIDPDFWQRHDDWRAAEARWKGLKKGGMEKALDEANSLRRLMFAQGTRSAVALQAKLEAIREGGGGFIADIDLPGGFTVLDVVRWDCERLVKAELYGGAAFAG